MLTYRSTDPERVTTAHWRVENYSSAAVDPAVVEAAWDAAVSRLSDYLGRNVAREWEQGPPRGKPLLRCQPPSLIRQLGAGICVSPTDRIMGLSWPWGGTAGLVVVERLDATAQDWTSHEAGHHIGYWLLGVDPRTDYRKSERLAGIAGGDLPLGARILRWWRGPTKPV